ncbi:MAG: O-antigen ligase family protein [Clostridia bacterium]|nr:O-antigen ligase family protein [Clostridia bacterium]
MEGTKPINKYYIFTTLLLVFAVFFSYVLNNNLLVLVSVLMVCAMIFFADLKTATCMLFLFSAFSYIIVYNAISLIVIVAVIYIFKIIFQAKINKAFMVVTCLLLGYCILFYDTTVDFKLGDIISIVFFLLMGVVCSIIKEEDFQEVFKWYLIGFVISAVMGMFASQIPSLAAISNIDYLVIDNYTTQENRYDIIRYAGLSYDPNFFSLSVCIIVSAILFGTKNNLGIKNLFLVLFLTVVGFFTYSKSYVIMIAVIYAIYFLKNDKNSIKRIIFGVMLSMLFIMIDRYLNLGIVQNIMRRFETDSATGNITTGRTALWKEYFYYIIDDVKIMLFGKGYNAHSLRKAAHNTYIEYWYHFGIFGCVLWIAYFYVCFTAIKSKIKNMDTKKNHIPLISFVVSIFFLNTLRFEHTWILLCLSLYSLKLPLKSEVLTVNDNIKYNSSGV